VDDINCHVDDPVIKNPYRPILQHDSVDNSDGNRANGEIAERTTWTCRMPSTGLPNCASTGAREFRTTELGDRLVAMLTDDDELFARSMSKGRFYSARVEQYAGLSFEALNNIPYRDWDLHAALALRPRA
jgi:hypothetical protein